MNSTLTLSANFVAPVKNSISVAQLGRTLVRKWDMLAVVGLIVSCGAYGVYAITQMTGF